MFGLFTYPKRLNNLYCDAVLVWVCSKEANEDAIEIATGAFVTAAGGQRESMAMFLEAVSHDYVDNAKGAKKKKLAEERIKALKMSYILACEDGMTKFRGQMKNKTYTAVQKGDETYFRSDSKLAGLFKNN
jgi:hypothetical protein